MRNLQLALQDPSISKWIKWVIVLLVLRTPRAPLWAAFLSLNRAYTKAANSNIAGNGLSAATLLAATFDNVSSPTDYLTVFAALALTPKVKKHWFPIIYGVVLSQFLSKSTPVPPTLAKYFLNPIWVNFTLTPHIVAVNITGLAKVYAKYNLAFAAITGILARELINLRANSLGTEQSLIYLFHRANALANLVIGPNLLGFLILSAVSPYIKRVWDRRLVFGAVGAVAGWLTLKVNEWGWFPAIGYHGPDRHEVRKYSPSLILRINTYVIRLLIVTKWRWHKLTLAPSQLKKVLRGELVVLSSLVWYLFNTYDDVRTRLDDKAQDIRANDMFKMVAKIKD